MRSRSSSDASRRFELDHDRPNLVALRDELQQMLAAWAVLSAQPLADRANACTDPACNLLRRRSVIAPFHSQGVGDLLGIRVRTRPWLSCAGPKVVAWLTIFFGLSTARTWATPACDVLYMQSTHPRRDTKGFEQIGSIVRRVVADMIEQRRVAAARGVETAAHNRTGEGGASDQRVIGFTMSQAPSPLRPS